MTNKERAELIQNAIRGLQGRQRERRRPENPLRRELYGKHLFRRQSLGRYPERKNSGR